MNLHFSGFAVVLEAFPAVIDGFYPEKTKIL
jgi:hypothetical protein